MRPLATYRQTFKNRPFPWILISVSSAATPSVTKKDDGSMEVEIAWTLPLTAC
jgi:hypothetical protein